MFLMLCPFVLSSIKKYCVCMEELVLNLKIFSKSSSLLDLFKYLIKDYSVICSGLILRKVCLVGQRTREESVLSSGVTLFQHFWRIKISIWFVELIKWWNKGINSSQKGSWWQYSVLQITVANFRIQEQ